MIVPRRRTPLRLVELVDALDRGHHQVLSTSLSSEAYTTAAAMLELEHGTLGGSLWAVWGWNLGNHDATAEERADPSVQLFETVPECEGSSCSWHATHLRRAYASPEDGAEGYWRTLMGRFAPAYQAIESPSYFAHQLKLAGYYTAPEADYEHALVRLARAWAG